MLRTIIIDDENHIRDTLSNLLEMNCPEAKVVGQASGVKSGIAAIKEHQLDLYLCLRKGYGEGFQPGQF